MDGWSEGIDEGQILGVLDGCVVGNEDGRRLG